jgi:hypothetical protein
MQYSVDHGAHKHELEEAEYAKLGAAAEKERSKILGVHGTAEAAEESRCSLGTKIVYVIGRQRPVLHELAEEV